MKTTVNEYDFVKAFEDYNRSDNFTIEGRKALYDYFTQLEEDTREEINLDVIAICCGYTQWENIEEFSNNHNGEFKSLDDIREHTQVIEVNDNSFITENY